MNRDIPDRLRIYKIVGDVSLANARMSGVN
jgi:hypothetical protein